jgi:uncharacterized membrane protein
MRLHQIRYDVALAPYDWTWNIIAAVLIVLGVALLISGRHRVPA